LAERLLASCDCFIKSSNVISTLKMVFEGVSKVIELRRFVHMAIWGEVDSQLLSRDCRINIGWVAQELEPTMEGDSEIT